jgi:hypothetical protein
LKWQSASIQRKPEHWLVGLLVVIVLCDLGARLMGQ